MKTDAPGWSLPPFVNTLLTALVRVWGLLFVARLGMVCLLLKELSCLPHEDIAHALYIGGKFDGRLAVFMLLPLALVLAVPYLERRLNRLRPWLDALYAIIFGAVVLTYITDVGFFLYVRQRLDATLFELLLETNISMDMVWQSYPVIWIMAAFAALVGCGVWAFDSLLRRQIALLARQPKGRVTEAGTWVFIPPMSRTRRAAWSFGLFVLFFGVAYAQISSNLFPLRWSNAYFSVDRNLATLALNPVQNLIDTTRNNRAVRPDMDATRESYPRVAAWLGITSSDSRKLDLWRHIPANPALPKPRNVVIILMESLSWPMTSMAPGADDPTPNLRALAKDGLYFSNFFAPARTTARSIFTTVTGIPDVNRHGGTSSRNQALVDQFMIFNEFKGYDKKYLIGGSASWANIRGVLTHNVTDLQLQEEGHWKAPNVDVWGISDLALFQEAVQEFNATPQPFAAFIQTAGFHRPYTIPADNEGFVVKAPGKTTLDNYGYESAEEYNSLRFSDHALGEFFRLARQQPWFGNTVFAILGDHGLNNSSANVSPGYLACRLQGSHVPLVLYAPGLIAPGVREFPAGHPDVFPTLAKLAGIEFRNHSLGRDLLDPATAATARQFISGEDEQSWRLVEDGLCYMLGATEGVYDLAAPELRNLLDDDPARTADLRRKARDMYTMSKYLLFNNKKRDAPDMSARVTRAAEPAGAPAPAPQGPPPNEPTRNGGQTGPSPAPQTAPSPAPQTALPPAPQTGPSPDAQTGPSPAPEQAAS